MHPLLSFSSARTLDASILLMQTHMHFSNGQCESPLSCSRSSSTLYSSCTTYYSPSLSRFSVCRLPTATVFLLPFCATGGKNRLTGQIWRKRLRPANFFFESSIRVATEGSVERESAPAPACFCPATDDGNGRRGSNIRSLCVCTIERQEEQGL